MPLRNFPRTPALFAALALILAACAVPSKPGSVPPGPGAAAPSQQTGIAGITRADEERLGARLHPQVLQTFGGISQYDQLNRYVSGIGGRLVANADTQGVNYRFFVLRSDVVNAFSLPGGYIYVTRGLLALASSEAQVAAVLAHEMSHVHARHALRRYEREREVRRQTAGSIFDDIFNGRESGARKVLSEYARQQEIEADELAVDLMILAGYDPRALGRFLFRMGREEELRALIAFRSDAARGYDIYATHPPTEARIRHALTLAVASGERGSVERERHLSAIDGMSVDGDRDNGFIRRQEFVHPALGFRFAVPEGFALFNLPDKVIAVDRDGALMRLDLVKSDGTAPDPGAYLTRGWARGVQLTRFERLTINGLPAATALATARTQSGTRGVRLVVIRFDANTIYRFMLVAPPGRYAGYDARFRDTSFSFRRLSPAEAARERPLRLRIIRVRPGDTVERLAGRMPYTHHRLERFLVLNNLERGETLEAGRRIKMVVD